MSVCYVSHVTSSLTNILFYFILLTFLLCLDRDYCFISRIVKLRLSTFSQNEEHDDYEYINKLFKTALLFLNIDVCHTVHSELEPISVASSFSKPI